MPHHLKLVVHACSSGVCGFYIFVLSTVTWKLTLQAWVINAVLVPLDAGSAREDG